MLFLGHWGVGRVLARPFLPRAWKSPQSQPRTFLFLGVGTLLPDLIDKPLYYANRWLELGLDWCTCTRTLGHTGLLALAVIGVAIALRDRRGVLVSVGMATHLLLDAVGDGMSASAAASDSSAQLALLYPIWRDHFGIMPFETLSHHAESVLRPYTVIGEVAGALVIARDRLRNRRREIR